MPMWSRYSRTFTSTVVILFMASTPLTTALDIKVKLIYFGAEFEMECATFRPASTGLDHT